ncbi:MAG: hypothetical protein DRO11_00185 [Methanobacteriota archaeon]|nr:MAG: hypothetical protein DRO11_00185 [Euryarchaeota archaeon]
MDDEEISLDGDLNEVLLSEPDIIDLKDIKESIRALSALVNDNKLDDIDFMLKAKEIVDSIIGQANPIRDFITLLPGRIHQQILEDIRDRYDFLAAQTFYLLNEAMELSENLKSGVSLLDGNSDDVQKLRSDRIISITMPNIKRKRLVISKLKELCCKIDSINKGIKSSETFYKIWMAWRRDISLGTPPPSRTEY